MIKWTLYGRDEWGWDMWQTKSEHPKDIQQTKTFTDCIIFKGSCTKDKGIKQQKRKQLLNKEDYHVHFQPAVTLTH